MKKNMGTLDRALRMVIALIIAVLYYKGTIAGTLGLVLALIAVVFALTSLMGRCPAYIPFGFSTCKEPKGPAPTP